MNALYILSTIKYIAFCKIKSMFPLLQLINKDTLCCINGCFIERVQAMQTPWHLLRFISSIQDVSVVVYNLHSGSFDSFF